MINVAYFKHRCGLGSWGGNRASPWTPKGTLQSSCNPSGVTLMAGQLWMRERTPNWTQLEEEEEEEK